MKACEWAEVDEGLCESLREMAERFFRTDELREDAVQEAKAWICGMPSGCPRKEYLDAAEKAMYSMERAERRQKGLPPLR